MLAAIFLRQGTRRHHLASRDPAVKVPGFGRPWLCVCEVAAACAITSSWPFHRKPPTLVLMSSFARRRVTLALHKEGEGLLGSLPPFDVPSPDWQSVAEVVAGARQPLTLRSPSCGSCYIRKDSVPSTVDRSPISRRWTVTRASHSRDGH